MWYCWYIIQYKYIPPNKAILSILWDSTPCTQVPRSRHMALTHDAQTVVRTERTPLIEMPGSDPCSTEPRKTAGDATGNVWTSTATVLLRADNMSEHKRTAEQHLVQAVRATELSLRHYLATPDLRSRGPKLAREVWKQHGEQLVGFLDRKMRRLQLATLRALAALATASTAIARELLQRIDSLDGFKQLITSCERAHGQAGPQNPSPSR